MSGSTRWWCGESLPKTMIGKLSRKDLVAEVTAVDPPPRPAP